MERTKKHQAGTFIAAVTACTAAAAWLVGGRPAIAADANPLAAFGRLPSLEDVAISPDGTKIAFVRTSGESRNLVVAPLTKPEILGGVRVGDAKLRHIVWVDDDNLLGTVSSTSPPPFGFTGATREWYQLMNFNVSKRKANALSFEVPKERTFNVITGDTSLRDVAGHSTLYTRGYCVHDRTVPCLFAFTYPDRRVRLVDEASDPGTDWLMDEAGNIAAQFTYQDVKKQWEIKTRKNGHWTSVASGTAAIDTPDMIGFSADGSGIIVRFLVNGDPQWRPLNLSDNTWGAPLGRGAAFYRVIEDRKSGRILGGIRAVGSNEYVFFDNELQAHWNAALRAFPDERVELESHSDDFSRLVLKVFGPKDGYVYALYDWYSHHASILGRVYEEVTAPAEMKAISYPAADGLAIPAFLTLPAGSAKDLPLIVLPHGGPAAADTLDFDWWSQALAAQGYAVLQPNFRGSTLDSKFMQAGFGEWGRKMQSDLSDGVRYLTRQGVIDPKRVCIVGASYGGYAALAGVTIESGVYRCAVSVAGLSDLRRFRKWTIANQMGWTQRYWDRFMGTADQNDPALLAISPIEHVAAVTVPVLLIHGRDDTVVPFEQSDVMLSALQRAGKSVTLVTMKHEDHWLSRSETRLQMLQATVDFLKANNPPN
ncbi:MAG TPA: S9 family peptidase [Steroidobacteraceae bacterium]|nr:S9 family peptidase [Steroidobacteraceae bacterium]